MNLMIFISIIVLSFFIGSIPFSYIITKVFAKKDIREIGSGNPGATNVVRALNLKFGCIALLLDMLKGAVPIYFIKNLSDPVLISLATVAIVFGHNYTPFLKFKGGKGVASSLGIFLVLSPIPTAIVAVLFFLITTVFRFVSLGSVLASVSYPIVAYLTGQTEYILLAILLGCLIVYKHKGNLIRLIQGNENKSI